MQRDKQQRIEWIKASSSGIGRSLALKMAAENWDIAATARSLEKLETLARESISLPGSIYPFASDITDTTKIKVTVDRIESECGVIDLAVLNAGTHISDDAATLTGERVSALLQLNVIGTVQCLHAWRIKCVEAALSILPSFPSSRALADHTAPPPMVGLNLLLSLIIL